jgi:hypothetical protein
VKGDRYAGEWPREAFSRHGIKYRVADLTLRETYLSTLPELNSSSVSLLDLPVIISQFVGLERRTSRVGRDTIDHAPGQQDDPANAIAGALIAAKPLVEQAVPIVAPIIFTAPVRFPLPGGGTPWRKVDGTERRDGPAQIRFHHTEGIMTSEATKATRDELPSEAQRDDREAQRARRGAAIARLRGAHGRRKSRKALDRANAAFATIDLEIENLRSAVDEAQRHANEAEQAEERAVLAAEAQRAAQIGGRLKEHAANLDVALAAVAAESVGLKAALDELNGLGLSRSGRKPLKRRRGEYCRKVRLRSRSTSPFPTPAASF